MRNRILFLFLILTASTAHASDWVDGKKFDEFEVAQWDGIDAPSVSAANSGRIYYDTTANKLKVSLNGGAYSDLSGGGGGSTDHQHPYYGAADHQHPKYDSSAVFADINHQHPSYGSVNHQHPIYVPFSDLTKQHIVTTANAEFVSTHVSGIPMPDMFNQSKHYTGLETHDASSLSFDNGTQTFTLTCSSLPIWINGKRFFFNTDTVTIPDTTGLYWIYIDLVNGAPDLLYSASAPGFEKCLVATVYWETTNDLSIVGNEQHWFGRDKWMHEYLHQTIGARYANGLTGTFTNTTLSITQGDIYDEDLEHNTGGTLTNADIFYKDGAATFEFDENQTTPYKAIAGTLQYNNGNTLTPVPVSSYVANWVYATNSTTRPIQVIVGQRVDATIANARTNNTPDTLSLGTLPSAEMKLLYRVIYRNVAGTATYIETADYRNVTPVPNGAFTPTDHSALSNLTWSTANHVINTDTDWGGYSLQNLGGPVNPTDGATKAYVDSNQHPVYATNIQNLANLVLVNAHPQYAPLSSMTHTHTAYAPISHAHGQYAPMSSMTHSHSNYAPISHAHTTYVPYSGATSTLNMGSQHMIASAVEVNNIRVNTHVLFTPGQTQSATGIVISGQAGEALSFGDVVYCKSNGKYYKAKADSNATIPAVAMAVSSAAANGYVSLLVNGFAVNSSWNFMAGCHVLVSPYTGEAITHSKVTVTGYQAQIVGYATNSTTIYFKPDYTYVEI